MAGTRLVELQHGSVVSCPYLAAGQLSQQADGLYLLAIGMVDAWSRGASSYEGKSHVVREWEAAGKCTRLTIAAGGEPRRSKSGHEQGVLNTQRVPERKLNSASELFKALLRSQDVGMQNGASPCGDSPLSLIVAYALKIFQLKEVVGERASCRYRIIYPSS